MYKLVLLTAVFIVSLWGEGDTTIEVIKKVNQLPSISVEDGTEDEEQEFVSTKFYRLLVNDLMVLTHFNVKDSYQKEYFGSDVSAYSNRNINYIVRYKLYFDDKKYFNCDIRLLSTSSQSELFRKSYKMKNSELHPFLAHRIINDINNHFGMPKVEWLTKYIIFSRYTTPKNSEIVIADYTLTYKKVVLSDGLNIFPKWASDKQDSFYFTRYENSRPVLYKMNLKSGDVDRILQTDGMLACSDVSSDGKKLLLTMAPNGQSDIYLYNTETKLRKLLTNYGGIDVNGHFIDDDKRITFISNRLGYPNIFAKDLSSKSVEQLVYYGKNNNSCTSFNNYIVYSSRESDNAFSDNTFNLHLISTNTNFVRRLTATGVNQFPKFSNDGESILFIKHYKNQSSLGVIRLKYNKSFLFPLNVGKIQSIDW